MVAERLGYRFIESGAMYRAVALLAIESNTSLENIQALTQIASSADIKFEWRGHENRIFVRGRDVTEAIRTPVITDAASRVSVHAAVRKELVSQQQALGRVGGVVMEGRDIGTVVFPNAEIKIFLDASIRKRSERRHQDDEAKHHASPEALMQAMAERDRRDSEREASPLTPAADSVHIDSTELSAEEVVGKILELVKVRGGGQ